MEVGYRRRDLVRWVVSRLALPVDLDYARYRILHRQVVWEEVRIARLTMAGLLTGSAAMFVVAYLIARYFRAPDAIMSMLIGMFGFFLLVLPPLAVCIYLLKHLPKTGMLVFVLFTVAMGSAAGFVVYGEIREKGPVHAMVGRVPEHLMLYLALHGVLLYAFVSVAFFVLAPIFVLAERRRRLRRNSTAIAVDLLFRCVELAHDEEEFNLPGTRRRLVTYTREVAHILQYGLWRSMWVSSPFAFSQLKKRCVHAGQSVEMLCADLVLPERTTHEQYLEKMLRLAETLLSGRLGELPDAPERAAYVFKSKMVRARRLAVEMAVSVGPLAMYLLLRHLELIPAAADVAVLTLCVAWLATYGLNALSRRYPDGSSQFPNVLGIFGSTK